VLGGALVGMLLNTALPEHHLGNDSKDVVRLGMGLIATLTALVLGLLIASAKGSYDAQSSELTQMSANTVLLDRVLAHYGPETKEIRDLLRKAVSNILDRIWTTHAPGQQTSLDPKVSGAEIIYDKIQELSPQNDAQRSLQNQALSIALDIGKTRWLLFEQSGNAISVPMLTILVFWLTLLFCSFGLFAPRNGTVTVSFVLSALSVAGAIFLILEMYSPFQSLTQISSVPLRNALAHLGQ
jgi:hypothetical protein